MPIEKYVPARSRTSTFDSDTFFKMDESGVAYASPHWLTEGKESFAASLDAETPQKAMADLFELFPEQTTVVPDSTLWVALIFPVLVDAACFEPAVSQQAPVEGREQKLLAAKLWTSFEADTLEDGMEHPAEQIIGKALRSEEELRVLEWFRAFALDAERPSFAASVLRCLGRQMHPGTDSWRVELVRDALAMDDVEIRDAAAQAAESWGGRDLIEVLTSHREPEPWLRDYIRDIIDDLRE